MARTPDELAKSLCVRVNVALDGAGSQMLRDAQKAFVAGDRPETSDPLTMATYGFAQFAVHDGEPDPCLLKILAGVMEFLRQSEYPEATVHDLRKLRDLLAAKPVEPDRVSYWFTTTYGAL